LHKPDEQNKKTIECSMCSSILFLVQNFPNKFEKKINWFEKTTNRSKFWTTTYNYLNLPGELLHLLWHHCGSLDLLYPQIILWLKKWIFFTLGIRHGSTYRVWYDKKKKNHGWYGFLVNYSLCDVCWCHIVAAPSSTGPSNET